MKSSFFALMALTLGTIFFASCDKSKDTVAESKKDKWQSEVKKDSSGNQYSYVVTYNDKLELHIKGPSGNVILTHSYDQVDSLQFIKDKFKIAFELTAPNKRINSEEATIAVFINYDDDLDNGKPRYSQVITNVNLKSAQVFTRLYKVRSKTDVGCAMFNGAIVQWYNGSVLIREGIDNDLRGGELGSRGTELVCYNKDFTVRFKKDIDLNYAYFPTSYYHYIPVNETDYILTGIAGNSSGVISRNAILTSWEDQYINGIKPKIWQVDLKAVEKLPSGYTIKIDDYSIVNDKVKVNYSVYDNGGGLLRKVEHHFYLNSGMPADQFNG